MNKIFIETIPKVSVCLIAYNHEKYIKECLESIVTQNTDFPFEIVIGEDKSTDNTLNIINEYKQKYPRLIRLFANKKNLGSSRNFINTLKECKGKYVAYIDGDDMMLPGKIQKQADYLDSHPDCVIVHHPCFCLDENKKKKRKVLRYRFSGDINKLLRMVNPIIHSSKMFRRTSMDTKFFEQDFELVYDLHAHLLSAQYGYVGFLNKILGVYRMHSDGMSATYGYERILDLYERTINIASHMKNVKSKSIRIAFYNLCILRARGFLKKKKRIEALKCYFSACYHEVYFNRQHLKFFVELFGLRKIR